MLKAYGSVDFVSKADLRATGKLFSQHFCGGVPFRYEEDLRDEVPGLVMSSELLGWTIVLYGGDPEEAGEYLGLPSYRVEFLPGSLIYREKFARRFGIGEWIAQLMERIPDFEVLEYFPKNEELVSWREKGNKS